MGKILPLSIFCNRNKNNSKHCYPITQRLWYTRCAMGMVFILLLGCSLAWANPDVLRFTSAVVWRTDAAGDYRLPKTIPVGSYVPDERISVEGTITQITASWQAEGAVRLEVSADGGSHYRSVTNGVPLRRGFSEGSRLCWRARLAEGARLHQVILHYQDSLGTRAGFGSPGLSGFSYRKPVDISSEAEDDLFNYQIMLQVAESSLAREYDVECAEGIAKDFIDVRFTAADGVTLLPYYRERVEGEAPQRVAVFWVRVPQIPPGGVPIYIYYGNRSAEDLSSAGAVFDFYDGFEAETLDTETWAAVALEQGRLSVTGAALMLEGAEIRTRRYQLSEGVLEFRAWPQSGSEVYALLRAGETPGSLDRGDQVMYSSAFEGAEHCIVIDDFVKANQPAPLEGAEAYDYRIQAASGTLQFERWSRGFIEQQAVVSYDLAPGARTQGSIGFKANRDRRSSYEWIRVRKYSPALVTVDRTITKKNQQEQVSLPLFINSALNARGELVAAEGASQGLYGSVTYALPYITRVLIPSWESRPGAADPQVEVSVDGGVSYAETRKADRFYYATREDFLEGNLLQYRLALPGSSSEQQSTSDAAELLPSSGVDTLSFDVRHGTLTLLSPNGGETLAPGEPTLVKWSARDYERDYKLDLSYSLDGGMRWELIAQELANSGSFTWDVPDVSSTQVVLRVADAAAPEIFDVSDAACAIGKAAVNELAALNIEDLLTDRSRPGTQRYDMVVGLEDEFSSEASQQGLLQHGEILMIRRTGHVWSENERRSLLIVPVYVTAEEAEQLAQPVLIDTGRRNSKGRPIRRSVPRRLKIEQLGLSLAIMRNSQLKEQKLEELRGQLETRTLDVETAIEQ